MSDENDMLLVKEVMKTFNFSQCFFINIYTSEEKKNDEKFEFYSMIFSSKYLQAK